MNGARPAAGWMILFAILWAMLEAIAGVGLRAYSPFQVVWTRYAVHLVLMVAIWGWRSPEAIWRTRRPAYQLGRSLLMVVMPSAFILGQNLSADPATFLLVFWSAPILTLALAHVVLREPAGQRAWFATTATVVACGVLLSTGSGLEPTAAALALTMAASFAAYLVMTRSLRNEPTRTNLFYTALGPCLALAPIMPFVWTSPGAGDLAIMAVVGVLGYGTLHALDRAAAATPLGITAPFLSLELVASIAIATIRGFDPLSGRAVVALVIIGLTTLLTLLKPVPWPATR